MPDESIVPRRHLAAFLERVEASDEDALKAVELHRRMQQSVRGSKQRRALRRAAQKRAMKALANAGLKAG